MRTIHEKLRNLKNILHQMEKVLIAFSGGVDSTFLVKVAFDLLQNKVLAVTAVSETYSSEELALAKKLAREIGVKHHIIYTQELDNSNFTSNPRQRCYFCKQELFSKLKALARQKGITFVVDGSNFDDLVDFRPGRKAAQELGIRSPLQEAGLTKKEIRILSKQLNLSTADKFPAACLASRFPYGFPITKGNLKKVYLAEKYLKKLGIDGLRVRHHEEIARIETLPKYFRQVIKNSQPIYQQFRKIGYRFVTLDLLGYRTGSLNETRKYTCQNL